MIKVFGKEYRNAFISRCVTYYLYLRKEAKLFLNLVYLMIDSELVINPNTQVLANCRKLSTLTHSTKWLRSST